MHIIHIASELAPLAKVGGLADVLLGLCRELSWKGHDIDIIIPRYDCMDSNQIRDLTVAYENLMSYFEGEWYSNTIWMGWVENLRVYFVAPHHPHYFFDRGCFYGCEDDVDRYLYFARTAIEFLYKKQLRPDIVHLHDWQTAIVSLLYKNMYTKLGLDSFKTVFTIHNIEYQGRCAPRDLDKIGLKGDEYMLPEQLQDELYPEAINLLKSAIIYSDFITTVSPNYAKEVKEPEGGKGLENILEKYQDKFVGILNGVDYSYWNPEIDRYLPAHYSERQMPLNKKDRSTIDKKGFLKKLLRERLLLAEEHRPIISCVTRLVPQKGIELIKQAISHTVAKGGQFVLLGSTPISSIGAEFHSLKHHYADHPHVHMTLHYQEDLSHFIYAASDMIIVPSIFEPCGLTQMIALKYGTIPIVRLTGGLADTIFDVDNSDLPFEQTNGYTFNRPVTEDLFAAMDRAMDCWLHDPAKWRRLLLNGMKIDFSWNKSSNEYLKVYRNLKGQSTS